MSVKKCGIHVIHDSYMWGDRITKFNTKYGKRHGLREYEWEDADEKTIQFYINDMLNGSYIDYEGDIKLETTYINNEENGERKNYTRKYIINKNGRDDRSFMYMETMTYIIMGIGYHNISYESNGNIIKKSYIIDREFIEYDQK